MENNEIVFIEVYNTVEPNGKINLYTNSRSFVANLHDYTIIPPHPVLPEEGERRNYKFTTADSEEIFNIVIRVYDDGKIDLINTDKFTVSEQVIDMLRERIMITL